ncbi:MAG: tricarballylate utilization 4Fe-4S protein TcuB [Hyphomicrobiaceae bacterium]
MQIETLQEARRQIEICNACRYCEGYCSVFPAINRQRAFRDADITQLANLCHNCRGCYYACQFTEPHLFALNLPKVLAEVRQNSWQSYAYPSWFAKAFHQSGTAIAIATIIGFALLFFAIKTIGGRSDDPGFYAVLSHNAMVAIFAPAFLFPVFCLVVGLYRYWKAVDGRTVSFSDLVAAFGSAAKMKNLAGGHGEGCNFEDEDRFSNVRRWRHQMVMYGFLLCFAATCAGTVMHYGLAMPAPYGLLSLPKLLGVPGGILLSLGTLAMAELKMRSDRNLADARAWGGEMGFILLLFFVSTSGLALYVFGNSDHMTQLLAIHLGSVLAFFLLVPYSKMAHGFYRLAALAREHQLQHPSAKATRTGAQNLKKELRT